MSADQSCEHCKYWRRLLPDAIAPEELPGLTDGDEVTVGECRRHPPATHGTPSMPARFCVLAQTRPASTMRQRRRLEATHFPITLRVSWCGEFANATDGRPAAVGTNRTLPASRPVAAPAKVH